jgi:hypothetical protein
VGDSLRAIYDQLSRDPNSLANLDQDLPNYAQHQVPIFSLPQEWLWCESWCSDESKSAVSVLMSCWCTGGCRSKAVSQLIHAMTVLSTWEKEPCRVHVETPHHCFR